jgi:hypothetical protein
MNGIRRFVDERRVYVALVGGAVLGLAIGLLIGWWVWPVEWRNSTPANLRQDFQDDYVMYVVENYEANGGVEWARQKLAEQQWAEGQLNETLTRLEEGQGGETLIRLRNLKKGLPEAEVSPPSEPLIDRLRPFLLVCGVALLVAAVVGGALLIVGRQKGDGKGEAEKAPPPLGGAFADPLAAGDVEFGEPVPPQAQFVTSYSLGDDHYDPSFSIELETGEFMGECGVGISDTLSSGEPSRVTAFEIWLFDKNDIRTVTKVLMSEYAFGDEALRTKLAPKGEPILAALNDEVVLETKRLRVQARILDVGYGSADLPDNSFFSGLTLDLSAWVKPDPQAKSMMADETPFL